MLERDQYVCFVYSEKNITVKNVSKIMRLDKVSIVIGNHKILKWLSKPVALLAKFVLVLTTFRFSSWLCIISM